MDQEYDLPLIISFEFGVHAEASNDRRLDDKKYFG
jgi:hypothetical protein